MMKKKRINRQRRTRRLLQDLQWWLEVEPFQGLQARNSFDCFTSPLAPQHGAAACQRFLKRINGILEVAP